MKFTDQCILSTAYWAPVQYFTKFIIYSNILIEQHETYIKQTYRNRCTIYGPNGIQSLQVPVQRGSFHKTVLRDLKIAYDTNWQKNHLKTIESAYRSSPFYDFYIDDIEPFFTKKTEFLIDLNTQILETCLNWLELPLLFKLTEQYINQSDENDFRQIIHPKSHKNLIDNQFTPYQYVQVFSDRFGFKRNLSILDLIFNTGPEAKTILNEYCLIINNEF